MGDDPWDPAQYERFKAERSAPFHDLVSLVEPDPVGGPHVVDLGCGTGELTASLARTLRAASVLGVDSSPRMLEAAAAHAGGALRFEHGDLEAFERPGQVDVLVSNAALQWVPDHESVLARWARSLRPGGQLAVQMPRNSDHPSHAVAARVAEEEPFLSAFGGLPPADPVALNVLAPEAYAELLHSLGFARQHVRLQVYLHVLPSTSSVVEWVKGTSLNRFRSGLDEQLFRRFVDRYAEALLAELGERRPYPYPFSRLLLWGRR